MEVPTTKYVIITQKLQIKIFDLKLIIDEEKQ